ncbi:glycoside hydrolase family 172 protein [Paenibacillus sacheonensis]|uniref:DUF2961 domain-containing protein n=1 Tax=Paenibacillus sacheonensis TaxID=742054 RepID=A0A7X4YNH1_9BACL|nr:glycoside hydrolase family 172 protein [Paenibacillus sacheonensis]MBM7565490.1 hypothetical protein [Paenibacillus sacheonensis]NBC69582.1 DUF2961 domain-containing protein [Paenibacillus sacheonensis]
MLYEMKQTKSRAFTAENTAGAAGSGGQANRGRKGAPCIEGFKQGETIELLHCEGAGVIRHIWMTIPPGNADHMRNVILRIYWDGQKHPSVETPIGDFFGVAHGRQRPMQSDCVTMQSGKGFNCWIPMPFKQQAVVTIENDSDSDVRLLFYQIDATLGDELDDAAGYFHARFRRSNPCPMHEDFVITDGIEGRGVYLGTTLGVRSLYNDCWWGEGEVKFYLDGDEEYPTLCGTGAEDYMGSAWGLEEVLTPYQGAPLVDGGNGLYSLYRFHVRDPIYFQERLKVTIQQIGYGSGSKAREHYGDALVRYRAFGNDEAADDCYFERSDDYCAVAYWYQSLPSLPFDRFPTREERSRDLGTSDSGRPARTDM